MKYSVKSIKLVCFSLMMMVTLFSCSKVKSIKNKKAVVVQPDNVKKEIDKISSISDNNNNSNNALTPDIDLTKMSITMIYSQIFNMLIMPEEYVDKTIKVKGAFEIYPNEDNEIDFFTLTVMDATACCKEGIDFIWAGNHTYPDDYPEQGQEITITGNYKSFETDEGITRNYLLVTTLEM